MPLTYTDNGDGTLTVMPEGSDSPITVADTPGIRAHLHAQNPALQPPVQIVNSAQQASPHVIDVTPKMPHGSYTEGHIKDVIGGLTDPASAIVQPAAQQAAPRTIVDQAPKAAPTVAPAPVKQPQVSTAVPGETGTVPDNTGELASAMAQEALDASDGEKARAQALHELGTQEEALGAAPQPKPVDPTEYYANIGHAFGAHSPVASRLIGGIVMGLFSGLGEIGGALSHRANGAQEIINQSIESYIQSQNQNNALSRQQWADQRTYLTELTANKTAELAAGANSQAIQDKAMVDISKLWLANANRLNQAGTLKPEQAEKIGRFEEAREAYEALLRPQAATDAANAQNGTVPALGTAAYRVLSAHVPFFETDAKAYDRAKPGVRNRIVEMLQQTDKTPRQGSEYEQEAEKYLPAHGDSPETITAKRTLFYDLVNRSMQMAQQTARGQDPSRPWPTGVVPRP